MTEKNPTIQDLRAKLAATETAANQPGIGPENQKYHDTKAADLRVRIKTSARRFEGLWD